MEFHLIRVQEATSIFPDVKAGVKCVLLETKILNSFLRKVHEEDKLGILDVHILMNDDTEIDTEIQLYVYIQDSQLILFMYLSQERVQDLGFPDIKIPERRKVNLCRFSNLNPAFKGSNYLLHKEKAYE